jgi:hypothetical protein
MKLFHWGLILRYIVYGVLPLIVLFVVIERYAGAGSSSEAFVILALLLPFVALGWLGYQHWRHSRKK